MLKRTIKLLKCPNSEFDCFHIFSHKLSRKGHIINNLCDADIQEDDDIISGVIVGPRSSSAYPISNSVGLLLSDSDTDIRHHTDLLKSLREHCPPPFKEIIDNTVSRLASRSSSNDGQWNREEMSYYDRHVKTEKLRQQFLENIKKKPLWHLYLPRYKYLLLYVAPICVGHNVLEIGCGNARTISWNLPPREHTYRYVGIDISWHRLLLAKSVIPEGDFMQASAFNLPFKDNVFRAVISFGVFHHLPSPVTGLQNCVNKLEPNGVLAFHEPIKKPKLLRDGSVTKKVVEKMLKEYDHSQHDGELELSEALALLQSLKCRTLKLSYSNSVIRPLMIKAIKSLPGSTSNKHAVQTTILLDQILLQTFCRLSKRLGPHAAYLVAQKQAA